MRIEGPGKRRKYSLPRGLELAQEGREVGAGAGEGQNMEGWRPGGVREVENGHSRAKVWDGRCVQGCEEVEGLRSIES